MQWTHSTNDSRKIPSIYAKTNNIKSYNYLFLFWFFHALRNTTYYIYYIHPLFACLLYILFIYIFGIKKKYWKLKFWIKVFLVVHEAITQLEFFVYKVLLLYFVLVVSIYSLKNNLLFLFLFCIVIYKYVFSWFNHAFVHLIIYLEIRYKN